MPVRWEMSVTKVQQMGWGLALALSCALCLTLLGPWALAGAALLPAAALWFSDRKGHVMLAVIMIASIWIPWLTFSFHRNGHFYLYPIFPLVQFLFLKVWTRRRFELPSLTAVDVFSLLFLASAVMSTLNAIANPGWSVRYIYAVLFGGYLLYVCLRMVTEENGALPARIWDGLMKLLLVSAGYSILEYILQYNILYPWVPFMSLAEPGANSLTYRSSSTFEHPLTAAHLFAVSSSYWFAKLFTDQETWKNAGALLLLLAAMLTTGSRAGLAASLICGMLVLLLLVIYRIWNLRTTAISLLALLLIGSLGSFLTDRFQRSFSFFYTGIASADTNRWNSMQWAISIFEKYWLWGLGPLNSDYIKKADVYSGLVLSADFGLENSWFSLLLEQGVVGAAIFLSLHLYLLIRLLFAIPKLEDPHERSWAISLFAGLFGFALLFATRNAAHAYLTWTVYFLLFFLAEHLCIKARKAGRLLKTDDRRVSL
jgi:hypothetical protein